MNTINVRDRKKIQTRAAIQQNAKRLFTERGFENTTMEQIAEEAVVSIGTLYNYFSSKGDILVAIMAEQAERSLSEAGSWLITDPENPVMTIGSMVTHYATVFLSLDSRLLGKSLALALEDPLTMGQRLFSIDRQLIAQVEEALKQMQVQGWLESSLNIPDTAYLLYSMGFMAVLLSHAEVLPASDTEEYIKRQVTLIIKPWLRDGTKKG